MAASGVDVDGFMRDGYVAIRGAVAPGTVRACQEMIWDRLAEDGVRESEPASWPAIAEIACPEGPAFAAAGTSPALLAAYDELIGPDRYWRRKGVGGGVVARFPSEERGNSGYHIEGSFDGPGGYWVNARSRARGLLALFLFSDVGPDDSPTRLVSGSHLFIPKLLEPHGENGMLADDVAELWRPSLLCRTTAHATGQAGDVFLCHPFIVHTATWPHRGTRPRIIAQPAVHVRDGFALDGSDPSPVARAIVAGLKMAED